MSAAHATQPAALSAAVSALHEVSPGEVDSEVRPGRDDEREPNGQCFPITLRCAAASTSGHPRIDAASPHSLAPERRPATPYAESLPPGRSASHVRARLEHAGTVCVQAMLSTNDPDAACVEHRDEGLGAPTNTAYEDCVRVEPQSPNAHG